MAKENDGIVTFNFRQLFVIAVALGVGGGGVSLSRVIFPGLPAVTTAAGAGGRHATEAALRVHESMVGHTGVVERVQAVVDDVREIKDDIETIEDDTAIIQRDVDAVKRGVDKLLLR